MCSSAVRLYRLSSNMAEVRPKLIVFDLDYTLWPFWVDTHISFPLRKRYLKTLINTIWSRFFALTSGRIVDSGGANVKCYKEVPDVLEQLMKDGYDLAVASRTSEIQGASQLMDLLGWNRYFKYKEIYPGRKTAHFAKRKSGIQYKDMLFFDDESRNITDLKGEGVTSILVKNGITQKVVDDGLKEFRNCYS